VSVSRRTVRGRVGVRSLVHMRKGQQYLTHAIVWCHSEHATAMQYGMERKELHTILQSSVHNTHNRTQRLRRYRSSACKIPATYHAPYHSTPRTAHIPAHSVCRAIAVKLPVCTILQLSVHSTHNSTPRYTGLPQLAYVPLVVERRSFLYHQVGELLHADLQRLYSHSRLDHARKELA
jgi:hypothetical protein